VWNARLDAPGDVTLNVMTSLDGNREILMPSDFPVRSGGLVKEKSANWEAVSAEGRASNPPARIRPALVYEFQERARIAREHHPATFA